MMVFLVLKLPVEPLVFGWKINIHLIFEYLAFFLAFRYYQKLRRNSIDNISNANRLSIILGAIVGAFLGSRIIGLLENPLASVDAHNIWQFLNAKSIMGGLFGGLLGVEVSKKIIHEKQSSGDLFVFPIVLGIIIGRVGCFLSGIKEFTYGTETTSFTGMDLGDGLLRHPVALYEIVFLILLFAVLKKLKPRVEFESGLLFKIFMMAYFSFRFFIEFIKPNTFTMLGLSTIQWLSVTCWLYYAPTIKKMITNAY
ncbi:MAG: prolipoprotein diacylglyceryl transferase [Arcticibacter sp.]